MWDVFSIKSKENRCKVQFLQSQGQNSKLSYRQAELGEVKQECSGLLTVLFIFFVFRKEEKKLIPLFPFSLQQDLDFLLSPEAWVSESNYEDRALYLNAY